MKNKILKLQELSERYEQLKEIQGSVKNLLNEYENFKIPVVFIGEFSAGKSSLINEFLKEDILEVDTVPTTAKPCEIYYCSDDNRYKKDEVEFLELNNVNLKHYKNIKIIDLPGISSQYYEHTNVTKDYLMKKDSVFAVVIDVSKGAISEEVLNFIKDLKDFQKEYILVISKTDKVEKDDAEKVLKNTLSILKENYKEPSYYCMVSVSDSKISDFTNILMKYDSKYDETRNKSFDEPLKNITNQIKANLENAKTLLQYGNEIDIAKLDMGIAEIEAEIPELESQKNIEIDRIKNSVAKEYDEVITNLENTIYNNFEEYVKNPKQLAQDVNNYLESQSQEINNKINHIFSGAVFKLNQEFADLETVAFFDNVVSKGGDMLNNLAKGKAMALGGKLLPKLFGGLLAGGEAAEVATGAVAAGEGATAVAVGGEAAATGAAGAMSATVILIPVAIISTVVIHKLLDGFKRTKTKENIENLLKKIKKDVNDHVKGITDVMANKIMDEYMAKIHDIRDQLREVKSVKLDKLDEKGKINQMEADIKLLESL
ncbi:MAG: hypothetical protein EVG15_09750 [Candidatus Acididesulfobacter diazotrophicus]|jgi:small GTP-binding protein|uniref:Dynamin N-terminal domain-containing protein n=1 Tax=Candidatus Acididesulfobacter diazotrophicus TaxID=2597226 RepID=A0A519BK97_9DELT|nr:MAG: hypothetical protein EVG15_09750 [Candidatus Acididesulfobacter diazotrophicus]